ncbi:hypothetical protein T261_07035 [Streptomyces lydicus]|nr:hypothetical protein T261_07035 [Streptomyces lydicus]
MARGAFALRTVSRISASCSPRSPGSRPFSLLTASVLADGTDSGRCLWTGPENACDRARETSR